MNKISMIRICCVLFLATTMSLNAQNNPSGPWMKYAHPSEAGFNPEKLAEVEAEFKKMRSASMMVIYKGKVLLDLGDVSRRFMTHSIRKSFMSAMYGIYREKGNINLYKTLDELNIDDKLGLTDREKQARVLDLLTARSGIYHPAAYEPSGMKKNRPERGSKLPGESFFYNNWDFNTLLPIIEQETGISFFDDFVKQIASPLGMEDLRMEDMQMRNEPDLSLHSAYLFKMSTRDMARFGLLYANQGQWNGQQILTEDWIKESTATYSRNLPGFPDRAGYGYLWWVDHGTFNQPAYYASGLGGHRIDVLTKSDMVIVHRVNTYVGLSERPAKIERLMNMILEAKTGNEIESPQLKELQPSKREFPVISLSEKELSNYVGEYMHRFFKKITVSVENDQLYLKGVILGTFRALPLGENRFTVEDLPELPLVFERATTENPKGKAVTEQNERGIPTRVVLYY